MNRFLTRSLTGLALAAFLVFGVVATTPDTVFSCGSWPDPPCCKPGQQCLGGGPGGGGGGGKAEAPGIDIPGALWTGLRVFYDLAF